MAKQLESLDVEAVEVLYNAYCTMVDGMFADLLWQVTVNRVIPAGAFFIQPGVRGEICIAVPSEGFVPTGCRVKENAATKRTLLKRMNKLVFGLDEERARAIVVQSMGN